MLISPNSHFSAHFSLPNLTFKSHIISLIQKKKSIVRNWLPVWAFSTAHHVQLCIRTWGTHNLHSVTPQKVTRCSWSWYTVSSTHHLDFIGKSTANCLISLKLKPYLLSLLLKSSILDSTPVEGQCTTRGSIYSKLIFFYLFCRQIDCYENPFLTILTRSTTSPVKLLFYFYSIPHRVVSEQPGIQHLSKTLSFSLCSRQSTIA